MMRQLYRVGLLVLLATAAHGQRVTAETKVRIDGKVQRVRKINGRWWSDDNRQLTPSKEGFIWWISGKKGESSSFHHHRPVNLPLAESLHLFMSPSSAEELLGEPNESMETGPGSRMWTYYAENGTALFVRFIRDELTEARYQRSDYGVSGRPVKTVEQELGGRDIFKVMADRAWQERSPGDYAKYHGASEPGAAPRSASRVSSIAITGGAMSSRPDPPVHRIPGELADAVRAGMSRAEVVKILGEPSGGMKIAGSETDNEVLSYPLEPAGQLSLRLEKGKVIRISR